MLGSSQSITGPNIALNTIMAEMLGQFADELESAEDFEIALQTLICKTLTDHQRIIFNGNGYGEEWKKEAAARGLSNHSSTASALPTYISDKNIALVTKRGIFTEEEFRARHEIHLEAYCKIIKIEAKTAIDIALHQILPAATAYSTKLCKSISSKKELGFSHAAENRLVKILSDATDSLFEKSELLRDALDNIPEDLTAAVNYCRDRIVSIMEQMRIDADILEAHTDKSLWPYPTYSDLLYY